MGATVHTFMVSTHGQVIIFIENVISHKHYVNVFSEQKLNKQFTFPPSDKRKTGTRLHNPRENVF